MVHTKIKHSTGLAKHFMFCIRCSIYPAYRNLRYLLENQSSKVCQRTIERRIFGVKRTESETLHCAQRQRIANMGRTAEAKIGLGWTRLSYAATKMCSHSHFVNAGERPATTLQQRSLQAERAFAIEMDVNKYYLMSYSCRDPILNVYILGGMPLERVQSACNLQVRFKSQL